MSFYYVPILKWKRGERAAVENLHPSVKDCMRPMFRLLEEEDPADFIKDLLKIWGANRTFYLDFADEYNSDPIDFLSSLFTETAHQDIALIPTVNPKSSAEFIQFISDHKQGFQDGFALMIRTPTTKKIQDMILILQNIFALDIKKFDLILDWWDLCSVDNDKIDYFSKSTISLLESIEPKLFRSVILTGWSFPETIQTEPNKIGRLVRKEFVLWKKVRYSKKYVLFGDHGIDDPFFPVFKPVMRLVPTIRYTKDDYWYLVRGSYDREAPRDFLQFRSLAKKLTTSTSLYMGPQFSWGDEMIEKVANGKAGTGNFETWVKYSLNHHLTYVCHTLSNNAT